MNRELSRVEREACRERPWRWHIMDYDRVEFHVRVVEEERDRALRELRDAYETLGEYIEAAHENVAVTAKDPRWWDRRWPWWLSLGVLFATALGWEILELLW